MAFLEQGNISIIYIAYVAVFLLAAIACTVSLSRVQRIDDDDTRQGIAALLVLSGAWAAFHVGFLTVPGAELKLLFYTLGLVVGLAAVGPWLYFCSAFTGRELHRNRRLQTIAVVIFAGFTAVKLTNPVHNLYFTWGPATQPFPHLAIQHGLLHWIAMGLSYALATVGYFMLFELLWQVDKDVRPLGLLVILTGSPLLLDLVSLHSRRIIQMTYEPLGVAIFSLGVLFLYIDDLQTVRLTAGDGDAVIVLDAQGHVRDFNVQAAELAPKLRTGAELEDVAPMIATSLEDGDDMIEIESAIGTRYYQVSTNPFSTDKAERGQSLTLTDVTEREQYRRELERQNDRLQKFASIVSHDLRNPLSVAKGRLDLELAERENENLDEAISAIERMDTLIDDLLLLAKHGESVDNPAPVQLSTVVGDSWEMVTTDSGQLKLESDGSFRADPNRINQLFENLFRNAIEHGGDDVTISVGVLSDGSGVYVADDGPGISESQRSDVFEFGHTSSADGTGYGLAIVQEIVEAHDWEIHVTESAEGGARFEITGVKFIDE